MTIPAPNLDDRNFNSLVQEARDRISQQAPTWTDRSDSDPGMVLLDVFAYLTELMLFRLNQLPDKVYIALLNLLGVKMKPPSAAAVQLQFTLAQAAPNPITIPRGTRVTAARASGGKPPPVFSTSAPLSIQAGATGATGTALNCTLIQAEPAGIGTGLPGQTITVASPPVIAPTGDPYDLLVAVEAPASELGPGALAISHAGRSYRVWREVESFTEPGPDRFVYLADRITGTISFAQAVEVALPDGTLDVAKPIAA